MMLRPPAITGVTGVTGVALLLAGSAAWGGQVIDPETTHPAAEWSDAERAKPIAVRALHRTDHSSSHLIRLQGSEFPHYHDHHDLTVHVLSGSATLHFADRDVAVRSGDVLFIPRGAYHWAENTGNGASVVFAVFAPPFDGKDRRRAE